MLPNPVYFHSLPPHSLPLSLSHSLSMCFFLPHSLTLFLSHSLSPSLSERAACKELQRGNHCTDSVSSAVISFSLCLIPGVLVCMSECVNRWVKSVFKMSEKGKEAGHSNDDGGFKTFLYNSATGECLGRTGSSWCKYISSLLLLGFHWLLYDLHVTFDLFIPFHWFNYRWLILESPLVHFAMDFTWYCSKNPGLLLDLLHFVGCLLGPSPIHLLPNPGSP